MRPFDPRPWFIAPASLLVACGPPMIPGGEEFGDDIGDDSGDSSGSEDTDDSSSSTDPDDTTDAPPPECYTDADCPLYYICNAGECEYAGWSDEYTDYSDYGETDTWFECYTNSDCPQGYACKYNYCEPAAYGEPIFCEPPVPQEIPLPQIDSVLELRFIDVDGDGDEELVMLTSTGVVTLMDDDSLVISPWPVPIVQPMINLTALDLEPVGNADVAVFSSQGGLAWLGTGDGSGGFVFDAEIPGFPKVSHVQAIDPELDGVDTIVAVVGLNSGVALFDDVAGLQASFEVLQVSGASGLQTGALGFGEAPDVLVASGCTATVRSGPNFGMSTSLIPSGPPNSSCRWYVGGSVPGEDHPFALLNKGANPTLLNYWSDALQQQAASQLPIVTTLAELMSFGEAIDPVLVVAGPTDVGLVWNWPDFPQACFASFPFVGTAALAAGDRDGDLIDEIALLDAQGVVRLFRVIF